MEKLLFLLQVKLPYEPICLSVGRLGRSKFPARAGSLTSMPLAEHLLFPHISEISVTFRIVSCLIEYDATGAPIVIVGNYDRPSDQPTDGHEGFIEKDKLPMIERHVVG